MKLLQAAILVVLLAQASASIPELMVGVSVEVVNQAVGENLGPLITEKIKEYNITLTINETDTVGPVKVEANLSNITIERLEIHWTDNVLEPLNQYDFRIRSRNINASVSTYVAGKVSLRKIHTTAVLSLSEMDMTLDLGIVPLPTAAGVGFGIKVHHIELDIRQIEIMFLNDTLDTNLANFVVKLIKNSLPNIINKAVIEKVNPAIEQLMSGRVFLDTELGDYFYTFDFNTTTLPTFLNQTYLAAPTNILITNLNTLKINPEIQNDQLPSKVFKSVHEAEIIASSGFVHSLIWLVEDSNVLNVVIDNTMLGDSPPITLDTSALTILLPKLPQVFGKDKGVYVRVHTSTKTPEMYIRSGRFIVSLSVNLDFIVDNTPNYPNGDVEVCLLAKFCEVATTLNTSVVVSAALRTDSKNRIFGNVQVVQIEDLQTYKDSAIEVDTKNLKMILNTLVGSFIPPVNAQLRDGIDIPMEMLKGLNITNIELKTQLDYVATGITFQLKN